MYKIEIVEHSDTLRSDKYEKLDVLMTACVNGVPRGVGCYFKTTFLNLNEDRYLMVWPV